VLSVRYVFRGLGDEAFGLILFNLTIGTAITSALELGLTSTTVKEVAAHFNTDPEYIRQLTRTATTVYWTIYLVTLTVVLIAAPVVANDWLRLRSTPQATAIEAIRLLGAGTLLLLPQNFYASLLRGRQRMGWTNLISFASLASQQIGIVVIVGLRGGLIAVSVWVLLCSIVAVALYALVCSREFGWSSLVPGWSIQAVKRTASFTRHMMTVSATSMIHTQSDKVSASRFLSVADFGFYAFISSVCARVSLLSGAVVEAALPSLTTLARDDNRKGLTVQYTKLHDLLCLTSIPVLSAVVFAVPVALPYVFTTAVAQRLVLPTFLLCLGFYMNASITVPYVMCVATGRPDIPARTNLLALVFVLPFTVVLVWLFGMVGGGLSWILFHVFSYAYLIPRACRCCLKRPLARWYLETGRFLIAGATIYGAGWVLLDVLNPSAIVGSLGVYIAATIGYVAAALTFVSPPLRSDLLRLPARLLARSR